MKAQPPLLRSSPMSPRKEAPVPWPLTKRDMRSSYRPPTRKKALRVKGSGPCRVHFRFSWFVSAERAGRPGPESAHNSLYCTYNKRIMAPAIAQPPVASKYGRLKNFVNGDFTDSAGRVMQVLSPLDGNLLAEMPCSSPADLDKAVKAAQAAFPAWSRTPIKERVQIFYRYRHLLETHMQELAALVSEENGKTLSEAVAEIEKCVELTEFAASLPQLMTGEVLEVSRGVECRTEHVPLGVVASIVPFNFPSMVPNWTLPNAIALGNCMIIKPSEKVPLSCGRLAELLKEAGLPDGVFNIVHGDVDIVNAICDHPGIEAVSFVGSTKVAKIVYQRSTSNYKRCLALGGAKNHLLVMPDANPGMTAANITASMSGCAGQRCMAASAMVAVGATDHIIDKLVE